jgi:integrase
MAYIEKRKHPNGKLTYRARIRQAGAPDLSGTFATRGEAIKWAQRMEAEVRAGRYFGKEVDRERTFAEFIDRYIEKELPKNPKGYSKQKMLLTWWKSHLGKYFLCHISPSMIAELRDKLMSETTRRGKLRTSSTANRYLAALSRAFTICVREWHWTKENPVLKITRPKENKSRERFLEKAEIAVLLNACRQSKSPHIFPVTLFALTTGARKGEILGLKWEDVNFKRNTATFRDTKNGETRTVHLSEQILNCLRNEQSKRIILSEFVFPNNEGNKPADIRTGWEAAVKKSGLKNICFHSLRHTCASHLAMSGVSTLEIGAVLGHKSISMVKRYSHLSTSSTAKSLMEMNDEILGEYFETG